VIETDSDWARGIKAKRAAQVGRKLHRDRRERPLAYLCAVTSTAWWTLRNFGVRDGVRCFWSMYQ
jgi:hypothetical protein